MTDHSGIQHGGARRELERLPLGAIWRIAMLVALALALVSVLIALLWLLARPLVLLAAAAVIATALAPGVTWLECWLPRTVAVVLVYAGALLVAVGLGWAVVPSLVEQAQSLIANAPSLVEQGEAITDRSESLPISDDQVEDAIRRSVERFGALIVALPMRIVSAAAELLLVVTMSAYLVATGPALYRFAMSLLPEQRRTAADQVLREMGATTGGYVRAQLIDGLIVFGITYVGLRLIDVEYPLVLAIIAGLGELVPIAGPIIAAVPALAVALLDSPNQALFVLVFYVALQQLESNILLPFIVRKQADIPPLLTLVALARGAAIGGVFGAVLAIPLAGALRVAVVRVVAPAVRRWTGAIREDWHTVQAAGELHDDGIGASDA